MDLLSSLSSRSQPNWLQATVSTILQNLIQTSTLLITLIRALLSLAKSPLPYLFSL